MGLSIVGGRRKEVLRWLIEQVAAPRGTAVAMVAGAIIGALIGAGLVDADAVCGPQVARPALLSK